MFVKNFGRPWLLLAWAFVLVFKSSLLMCNMKPALVSKLNCSFGKWYFSFQPSHIAIASLRFSLYVSLATLRSWFSFSALIAYAWTFCLARLPFWTPRNESSFTFSSMTEEIWSKKGSSKMFKASPSNWLEQPDKAVRIGFKDLRIVFKDFKSWSFLVIVCEGSRVSILVLLEVEVELFIEWSPDLLDLSQYISVVAIPPISLSRSILAKLSFEEDGFQSRGHRPLHPRKSSLEPRQD